MTRAVKHETVLGLDIGTLGVKGVIVAVDGRVIARARLDHGISHPQPGWAEQDAEAQWWGDGVSVIRELLAAPGVDPSRVAAIGVCGLTPCLCLCGEDGRSLRPAILYSDNRALEQLARVQAALGVPFTAQAVTPKWAWLAEHEPEVVRGARWMLSSHNYVVHRLTGVASMDYDTASIIGGVFDARRKAWDVSACAALGLDAGLLPPLHAATDAVGGVTLAAAQATGLPPGTPVIAGTGDTFPTIVGCGAVTPGDAMIAFGTTGLLTLTTQPLETAAAGPHFGSDAGEGAVTWAANVLACGRLLAWYRETFGVSVIGVDGRSPLRASPDFVDLDHRAAMIPAGSAGLIALPHLIGRRTPTPDPRARSVLFGLTPEHTAAHVYRALLESFGYAVRQGFEPIRSQARRVIATAGGAASLLWRQIMTDILRTPIEYHPQASGALGIAFLAVYASGLVGGFEAIRDDWLTGSELTVPGPAARQCYDDLYGLYCHLDGSLSAAFAMLASPHV